MITPVEIDGITNLQTVVKKRIVPKTTRIKEVFIDWSLDTKFDGYNKIFIYKLTFVKILWLKVFLFFSGLTAYLAIKCVLDYYTYDVVSKIEMVYERPTIFPAVTICDVNPFTTQQAQDFIQNIILTEYGFDIDPSTVDTYTAQYMLGTVALQAKVELANRSDSFKKTLGFSLDTFFSCSFDKAICNKSADFRWYYSYEYGNCWQYNADSSLKTTATQGKDHGLSLLLVGLASKNKYPLVKSKGLVVFVHNQSFDPYVSDGVFLETGTETNMAIQRTFSHSPPDPYSECQDISTPKSDIHSFILASQRAYRQKDCLDLCLQKQIITNCGCYFVIYEMINPAPACQNFTQYTCIGTQYLNFKGSHLEACMIACPLECDLVRYDLQLSKSEFPNREYYNVLMADQNVVSYYEDLTNQTPTYESFREIVGQVNVYYPHMKYIDITETPKLSPFDLFAQIGGSLGAFLGFCLFQCVEILELLYLVAYTWIKNG